MAHKTNLRSFAMSLAWAIRKQTGSDFGQCQRLAWRAARLRSALQAGAVEFEFIKDDGSTRRAYGTLCPALYSYDAKGTAHATASPVIKFYDLNAGGFRSFRADRLTTWAA